MPAKRKAPSFNDGAFLQGEITTLKLQFMTYIVMQYLQAS